MKKILCIPTVVALAAIALVPLVRSEDPAPEAPAALGSTQWVAPPDRPTPPASSSRPAFGEDRPGAMGRTPAAEKASAERGLDRLAGGAPIERVERAEAARSISLHLAGVPRDEAAAFARSLAEEPEMAAEFERAARRLAGSADPTARARGALLLHVLGRLDAAGWCQALAGDPAPEGRAALLAHAPLNPDGRMDSRIAAALVERAATDPSPVVRAAGIDALPAALEPGHVRRLVAIAAESTEDPAVRLATIRWFAGSRTADAGAARDLLRTAERGTEDREIRRASAIALLKIDRENPGFLQEAGITAEALHAVLAATGRRKG